MYDFIHPSSEGENDDRVIKSTVVVVSEVPGERVADGNRKRRVVTPHRFVLYPIAPKFVNVDYEPTKTLRPPL